MKQIVRFFYNKRGIGDTLLVRFLPDEIESYARIADVCVLTNKEGQVVGYNVFAASTIFDSLYDGGYFFDQGTLDQLNKHLIAANFASIEADTQPKFYVGEVIACEDHPNSKHLHMCKVDLGNQVLDVVCGAANVATGMRVVCATQGAVLPNGDVIVGSSVLGVPSFGMLCSYQELQLPLHQPGIIALDDRYVVGSAFAWKG